MVLISDDIELGLYKRQRVLCDFYGFNSNAKALLDIYFGFEDEVIFFVFVYLKIC